jgi:hypothetical protein
MKRNAAIEIFKDKKDQFRFRIKGANGEIVAQSEGYTTKAKCKKGIDALGTIFYNYDFHEEDVTFKDLTIKPKGGDVDKGRST